MSDSISSISLSKDSVVEEMSAAFHEDALKRTNDSISNESIDRGTILLDTYTVTSDAFAGGMGSVWRVFHNNWKTQLAMKRPKPRFFAEASETRKKNFIRECENWIRLGLHPNIVSCYYVREVGGVPTIFSEWMDNGSLRDRIRDGVLYDCDEDDMQIRLLDISIQFARGLQYAHANGLLHQDIKPGNLLLTANYEARISDFGLSQAKSALSTSAVPVSGYTMEYCPAEQAEGAASERWMDVYAWAVSVLEMYAGCRVWSKGSEVRDAFDRILASVSHPLPDGMSAILRRCVQQKTDDMNGIIGELLVIFRNVAGCEYPRTAPEAARLSADSYNNYALSFLDLGKTAEAAECWNFALKADPNCIGAVYNHALHCLRSGEIDTVTAVDTVKTAASYHGDSEEGLIALANIQLECRDTALMETAARIREKYPHAEGVDLDGLAERAASFALKSVYTFETPYPGYVNISRDAKYLFLHDGSDQTKAETVVCYSIEEEREITRLARPEEVSPPAEMRIGIPLDSGHVFGRFQGDSLLYKWDTRTGEVVGGLRMVKLPDETISMYQPDGMGKDVLACSTRGRYVVWHSESSNGISISTSIGFGQVGCDFSRDGRRALIFNTGENALEIVCPENGEARRIAVDQPMAASFALKDSCVLILSGGAAPKITLYDIEAESFRYELPFPRLKEFTDCGRKSCADPDGDRIFFRLSDGYYLFDIAKRRWQYAITSENFGGSVNLIAGADFCADGRFYVNRFAGVDFEGYELPAFGEESTYALSHIHTAEMRLQADRLLLSHAKAARYNFDRGEIGAALEEIRFCREIEGGKYVTSPEYIALLKTAASVCGIAAFGRMLRAETVPVFSREIRSMALSGSGKWLAVLSQRGELAILDSEYGKTVYADRVRKYSFAAGVKFAGDTLYALVTGQISEIGDKKSAGIRISDGSDGTGEARIAYSGIDLTSNAEPGQVWEFDLGRSDGNPEKAFDEARPISANRELVDFSVSPDGNDFILRRFDGVIYHQRRNAPARFIHEAGEYQFAASAISPDGKTACIVSWDMLNLSKRGNASSGKITLINAETGKVLREYGKDACSLSCRFSDDGKLVAAGSSCIAPETGAIRSFKSENFSVPALVENRYLVCPTEGNSVTVYDIYGEGALFSEDIGRKTASIVCTADGTTAYIGDANGCVSRYYFDHVYAYPRKPLTEVIKSDIDTDERTAGQDMPCIRETASPVTREEKPREKKSFMDIFRRRK